MLASRRCLSLEFIVSRVTDRPCRLTRKMLASRRCLSLEFIVSRITDRPCRLTRKCRPAGRSRYADSHRIPGYGVTLPTHHSLPELYSMKSQNKRGGPVSRVLYRGCLRRPRFAARRAGAPLLRGCRDTCTVRTIYLGRPSPAGSCSLPAGWSSLLDGPSTCCSALLLARFTVPPPLPATRWALTPPFHPHRQAHGTAARLPAVCFLWHCLSAAPSDAAARALPGAMPIWSPDFPPPVRPRGAIRRRCTGPPLTSFAAPMRRRYAPDQPASRP